MRYVPHPLALSVSKGRLFSSQEERCFDKLSTNGIDILQAVRTTQFLAGIAK